MSERDAPQQPIPPKPDAPGADKENPYGPYEAEPRPGEERGRIDKPSTAADDLAIDEERGKKIRGNEAPKDVADPD